MFWMSARDFAPPKLNPPTPAGMMEIAESFILVISRELFSLADPKDKAPAQRNGMLHNLLLSS